MLSLAPLSALTLSLVPALPQEPPLPDAVELLARMRARLGEPARLDAIASRRLRGSARWEGIEGAGEVTEVYAGLSKARLKTRFESFGDFELGFDGETVWERTPAGVEIRTGWQACEYVRRFGRAQHVDWKVLYTRAACTGIEELDGRRCYALELVPRALAGAVVGAEEPPPDRWLVDVETLLPVRIDARSIGAQGDRVSVVTTLSDWRSTGGVLYPHRRAVEVSGFTLVLDTTSVEHDVELPEGYFDPGDDVRAAARERREPGPPAIAVETLEARHIASIRTTCKHDDMQRVLAVLLPEVFGEVIASGTPMTGQPLVRYHGFGDTVDLEAAIPVAHPIEPRGRVKPATLPKGQAVVALHIGPYDRLGETHARIEAFIEEHGLERSGAAWEEYLTDPGMEPDPANWRTRVVWPVRRRGSDL